MRILLTEYFKFPNVQRQAEVLYCLFANSEVFDEIHLLNESRCGLDLPPNTREIVTGQRLTFKYAFEYANSLQNQQNHDEIPITAITFFLANNDISFEKYNFHYSDKVVTSSHILALSRWELKKDKSLKVDVSSWSQDTWVWRGKLKVPERSNYFLGLFGCDSKLSTLLKDEGYTLLNPVSKLVTVHHHLSNFTLTSRDESINAGDRQIWSTVVHT